MTEKKQIDSTMLGELMEKKTRIMQMQAQMPGKDFSAALREVDRQLGQNAMGEPVTKSGQEDDNDSSR